MVGLVKTDPIEEIQDGLEKRGCIILDRQGSIDQVRGFELAAAAGFQRIAVTIAGKDSFAARRLRQVGERLGKMPFILAVHITGVGDEEALVLAECCDLVWACASRAVREVVGPRARLQIGISIPVFALTDAGKRLVLNRAHALLRRTGASSGRPAAGTGGKATPTTDLASLGASTLRTPKMIQERLYLLLSF